MMMRASKLAALALAVVVAVPALASAGPRRDRRAVEYVDEPPPAYFSSRQGAGRCAPMCDRDFSPCDPVYFKIADGRCAGITDYGR